jgi:hypothetical protein
MIWILILILVYWVVGDRNFWALLWSVILGLLGWAVGITLTAILDLPLLGLVGFTIGFYFGNKKYTEYVIDREV